MAILTDSGGAQLTTNAGKILVRDTGSILGFNSNTTTTKTTVTDTFNQFTPTQLSVNLTVRSNTSVVLLSCSTVVYTAWHATSVFLDFGVSGGGFTNNTRFNTKDFGLAGGVGHKYLSVSGSGTEVTNFSSLGFNISDVHTHGQVAGSVLTYRLLMMAYDKNQSDGGAYTADANYFNIVNNTTEPNQIYPIITAMEISN